MKCQRCDRDYYGGDRLVVCGLILRLCDSCLLAGQEWSLRSDDYLRFRMAHLGWEAKKTKATMDDLLAAENIIASALITWVRDGAS